MTRMAECVHGQKIRGLNDRPSLASRVGWSRAAVRMIGVMSWIRTVAPADADAELRELYRLAVDPSTGQLDHVMQVHGLHPAGLRAHLELYCAVMRGTVGLPAVDRELIAFVVSLENECDY